MSIQNEFDADHLSEPYYEMTECEIIRARDRLAAEYSRGLLTERDFVWLLAQSREALAKLATDKAKMKARQELETMIDKALSWTLLDSLEP